LSDAASELFAAVLELDAAFDAGDAGRAGPAENSAPITTALVKVVFLIK
jgi:hypothetical protein